MFLRSPDQLRFLLSALHLMAKKKHSLPDLDQSLARFGALINAAPPLSSVVGSQSVASSSIVRSVPAPPSSVNENVNPISGLLNDISSPLSFAPLLGSSSKVGENPMSPFLAANCYDPWPRVDVWLLVVVELGCDDSEDIDNRGFASSVLGASVVADVAKDVIAHVVMDNGINLCGIGLACSGPPCAYDNAWLNFLYPSLIPCNSEPNIVDASPPRVVPKWTLLFSMLPNNMGMHSPCSFDKVEVEGVMISPMEVLEAGVDFWKDYLVGFLLESNPDY